MNTKFRKKFALICLIIVFVGSFSPLFVTKASAQWFVWDPGNFVPNAAAQVKDYGLDSVAWVIVNLILERMAASTVKWINSGFNGSPAFVSNPESYFQDIGDKIAGQYIFTDPNLNFLCGPIQAKVRLALVNDYAQLDENRRWQCTLTQVGKNFDNFMNNFDNGGWENFFEISQKPQNSPLGAYMQAKTALDTNISSKINLKQTDLLQGKGFMSWTECTDRTPPKTEKVTMSDGTEVEVSVPGECKPGKEKVNTPGSVISDQLNKTLGAGSDKLNTADEINEIVSALLNQLMSKIVGGMGKGLRSLSEPDSSNSNSVFTTQLGNSTKDNYSGYFGDKTDTSILNKPLTNPEETSASNMPDDADCDNYSRSNLVTMVMDKIKNSNGAYTEDDAQTVFKNLDCDPVGIRTRSSTSNTGDNNATNGAPNTN